jgi:hypothetical protein
MVKKKDNYKNRAVAHLISKVEKIDFEKKY